MADMSIDAIATRWETGYRVFDRGPRFAIEGQPDPRQDVRALLGRVRELEGLQRGRRTEPTPTHEGTAQDEEE